MAPCGPETDLRPVGHVGPLRQDVQTGASALALGNGPTWAGPSGL